VPEFLSDEWVDALDAAVSSDAELARRANGATLVVQYVVEGDVVEGGVVEGPARSYHLVIADDAVRARSGPAPDPTVVFTTDRATAAAIATGRERAQVAFMAGRLRLGGDVTALLAHRDLLAGLDAVTEAVRDRTAFPA
jgi:putative sterol carrier protein